MNNGHGFRNWGQNIIQNLCLKLENYDNPTACHYEIVGTQILLDRSKTSQQNPSPQPCGLPPCDLRALLKSNNHFLVFKMCLNPFLSVAYFPSLRWTISSTEPIYSLALPTDDWWDEAPSRMAVHLCPGPGQASGDINLGFASNSLSLMRIINRTIW